MAKKFIFLLWAFSLGAAPLIHQCKALILVNDSAHLLEGSALSQISGFYVKGLKIPGGSSTLEKKLAPLYLNQDIDEEKIEKIKMAIYLHYQRYHHPLIVVETPTQNISYKTLQLTIVPARLGSLTIEGNEYTPTVLLKEYLQLKPNEEIDTRQVIRDLNFINRNPFRRVDAVYAPGLEPYTTDITLISEDHRPFRLYTGVDDIGIQSTGRSRYFMGFIAEKVWGLNHVFSSQYTSAYNRHNFFAITAQYTAFLPWKNILNVYGGYSHIQVKNPSLVMENHGYSTQGSFRYMIPFGVQEFLSQNLSVGGDFKRLSNTLLFNVASFNFAKAINLTQLMCSYSGKYEGKSYQLNFKGDMFFSPGAWLPDQTNSDFNSQREGAKNQWIYFNGELSYEQILKGNFSFYGCFRGQATPSCLIPSEQVGIGGYDTVRGYEERAFNADEAIILNAEIRSPSFSFSKKKRDTLYFLAFFDCGYGYDYTRLPEESKVNTLIGIGPGLRYKYDPYITTRLDWGIKLHSKAQFTGGSSMLYYTFMASF